MKIINKYISKEILIPFSYCFLSFVIIYILGDLFENLDNFISQKVGWLMVGRYYLFLIPAIFVLTTPLAILLSILYQLGYMSRHNELVALKASGVSFWRIMVPFIILGLILSVLLLAINEKLVPNCSRQLNVIRETAIKKKADTGQAKDTAKFENIAFFSSLYNLSFYIDKVITPENRGYGINIREFYKDGSIKREWYGEEGLWIDSNWWLFDGYIRTFFADPKKRSPMQFFEKRDTGIEIPVTDMIQSGRAMETLSSYMNIRELFNYIKRNYSIETIPRELLVDLYRKLTVPVTVLVITFFGIVFGSRISKGGAMASVGFSIAFYIAYYGLSSFFIAMGKLGRLPPGIAVWTPQMLFGGISVYLLTKAR